MTDILIRSWRELQARIVAAALRLVIDVFQQILEGLERILYFVDEWLRFRRGEHRVLLVFKAILGCVWSVVTYVLRFCITLFIEPQFNLADPYGAIWSGRDTGMRLLPPGADVAYDVRVELFAC